MSFSSRWPSLRQRARSKPIRQAVRRPKLEFERLEDRTLLDSGLGQIAGLTDTPQERFVTGLYYDLLYRVPQAADVAAWVNALNAGLTPTDIAARFTASPESQGNFVLDNYNNYLHRSAAGSEIGGWVNAMQTGLSEEAVSASFLSCDEYYLKQGGNNTGWLTGLYQDLLGRAPDSSGLTSWLQVLQRGTARNAVAAAIANSPEADGILVQTVYQKLLGRNPDPSGLGNWVAVLSQGMTAGQFTARIAGCTEYWNGQTTNLAATTSTSAIQGSFHFDFGPGAPAVPPAAGYLKVPLVNFLSSRGYGWSSVLGLGWHDRNGTTVPTRDFHWGQDGTFQVNVANGSYVVTVGLGDAGAAHANTAVWVNGVQEAAGVNTAAGQFVSLALPAQITNGQLSLRIAGGFALDSLDITKDTAPVPNAGTAQSINEGSAVSFAGSETGGVAPFTYAWNFGDGATATGSLSPSHTYVANGVYSAKLIVTDALGLAGTASATITVNNVAPANVKLTPSATTINLANTLTLGGSFTDPGPNDTHQVSVDWGDGSTKAAVSLAAGMLTFSGVTHQYSAVSPVGGYTVTVTVTDKDGAQGTGSAAIIVNGTGPTNINLTPSATAINENDSITLGGTFTEPGSADTHQVSINWGDGSTKSTLSLVSGVFSFSGASHQYLDNPTGQPAGSFTVTVTVTDQHSGQGSGSTSIQVNNLAPAGISLQTSAAAINEGSSITLGGSFTDPGTKDTHQVTIVWADGSADSVVNLAAGVLTFSGVSHKYDDNPAGQPNGSYLITVTIADNAAVKGSATASVQVNALPPTVTANGPYSGSPGTAVTFTATVTDPSSADTAAGFTYLWNFGDGVTSTSASPSHTYAAAATYTVSAKVTNEDGLATTATTTANIAQTSPAGTLQLTGFPLQVAAGAPGNVTVTAFDSTGHLAPGYTGTVHFRSSDGQAVLPGDYTFGPADLGVHTFSVTLKTAGTHSITATDKASASITGTEAGITVNPGALSALSLGNVPTSLTAATVTNFKVTAQDAYGNRITGYTGTVDFSSSSRSASLPSPYTFTATDQGVHTFNAALNVTGAQSLAAIDAARGLKSTTSLTVTQAQGSSFYVATTGSDTAGTGTLANPWRTINHGIAAANGGAGLKPGDTLYLRGGTYAEALNNMPLGSGTGWNAPVTIAAYPGETPIIEPGTGLYVLHLNQNLSYVVFQGLVFDATGNTSTASNTGACVYVQGTAGISINHLRWIGCEMRNTTYGQGIELGSDGSSPDYMEILDTKIHDIGMTVQNNLRHGYYINSNYNLLDGDTIYNTYGLGGQFWITSPVAGTMYASYNTVRNSTFYNCGNTGGQRATIGIYYGTGNAAYNNVVHAGYDGIVTDYGATNSLIYNNTVVGMSDDGIRDSYSSPAATGNQIINNIAYNNGAYDIRDYGTNTKVEYNLIGQASIGNFGTTPTMLNNLLGSNPLFVNAASNNYHLQLGSPAISAGMTLVMVAADCTGTLRPLGNGYDIGAFEDP